MSTATPDNDATIVTKKPLWLYVVGIVAAGIVLGVAGWYMLDGGDTQECVSSSLSLVSCGPEAYATLLATAEVVDLGDVEAATLQAAEVCPINTMETAYNAGKLLCLGPLTTAGWGDFVPTEPGECFFVATDTLDAPVPIPCPEENNENVVIALATVSLTEPPSMGIEDKIDAYAIAVLGMCELGAPLGPSFFEWSGGATDAICVVPLS